MCLSWLFYIHFRHININKWCVRIIFVHENKSLKKSIIIRIRKKEKNSFEVFYATEFIKKLAYLWMTKLGGPVKGLRPSDKLRPETDPAQEWLLIDPASRRLALSKHKDEAKILARTLCLDPRRTVKKRKEKIKVIEVI